MKRVLALDLGSNVGWATNIGTPARQICGTEKFRPPREWTLYSFSLWLRATLNHNDLDATVFERPITRGQAANRLLWGMAGIIEAECYGKCACLDVSLQTVKANAGSGRFTKEDMIRSAKDMGWNPQTEHEADALWLLDYTLKNMVFTA